MFQTRLTEIYHLIVHTLRPVLVKLLSYTHRVHSIVRPTRVLLSLLSLLPLLPLLLLRGVRDTKRRVAIYNWP